MEEYIICPACGFAGTKNAFDLHDKGIWCPVCNKFIWNNPDDNTQQTTLILEQGTSSAEAKEFFGVPKLNKRLSPLRYPGGKSKMIDYLYTNLKTNKCETFVEVFAGGCSFGLALLDAGLTQHLVINDKDEQLTIFWSEILNNKESLIKRLQTERPNHKDYLAAKELLTKTTNASPSDVAWAYLLVNRLSFSGIQIGGCLGGLNGTIETLLSRYKPDILIKRINRIAELKDKITILNLDYKECIEKYYWDDKTTLFIDPPYYKKGQLLYKHYFEVQDHIDLSELIIDLVTEFPGTADILMAYDNDEFIQRLYKPHFTIKEKNRKYSI